MRINVRDQAAAVACGHGQAHLLDVGVTRRVRRDTQPIDRLGAGRRGAALVLQRPVACAERLAVRPSNVRADDRVLAHGGGRRAGLVDEFQLFVQPVVLGAGRPFFPALDDRIELELRETRRFGTGVVYLRYATVRHGP
jgi:hypothetical protein